MISKKFFGSIFLFCNFLYSQNIIIDSGSINDSFFTGGLTQTIPAISGDKTVRYSTTSFKYKFPAPATSSIILFTFIEPSVSSVGARLFSVKVNSVLVFDKLDIFKEVGFQTPLLRAVPSYSVDGFISIEFSTQVRSAVVSSILCYPMSTFSNIENSTIFQRIDFPSPQSSFTLPIDARSITVYRGGKLLRAKLDYLESVEINGAIKITFLDTANSELVTTIYWVNRIR